MVVAVTGGIATGKSTVTRMLKERGGITFSADEAARAVQVAGGSACSEILALVGPEMFDSGGNILRAKLAKRIFANNQMRESLNRIMHPRIRRLLVDQVRSAQEDFPPSILIIVEVPLLFESNQQNAYEQIVVVTASEPVQIARQILRNDFTESQAIARIRAQLPLAEKISKATYVVVNDGSPEELAPQVDILWSRLNNWQACN